MKCFRDTVTLFCPRCDGTRTEYLLDAVRLCVRQGTADRKGELFIVDRRSRAWLGTKRTEIPAIYTGCYVAPGDIRGLPPDSGEGVMTVVGVGRFNSETGRGDHYKVELG